MPSTLISTEDVDRLNLALVGLEWFTTEPATLRWQTTQVAEPARGCDCDP